MPGRFFGGPQDVRTRNEDIRELLLFWKNLAIFSFRRITKYLTAGETETIMKIGFRASRMEASNPCRRRTFRKGPMRALSLLIVRSGQSTRLMHPEDLENQSHRKVRSPHIGTAFHADRV